MSEQQQDYKYEHQYQTNAFGGNEAQKQQKYQENAQYQIGQNINTATKVDGKAGGKVGGEVSYNYNYEAYKSHIPQQIQYYPNTYQQSLGYGYNTNLQNTGITQHNHHHGHQHGGHHHHQVVGTTRVFDQNEMLKSISELERVHEREIQTLREQQVYQKCDCSQIIVRLEAKYLKNKKKKHEWKAKALDIEKQFLLLKEEIKTSQNQVTVHQLASDYEKVKSDFEAEVVKSHKLQDDLAKHQACVGRISDIEKQLANANKLTGNQEKTITDLNITIKADSEQITKLTNLLAERDQEIKILILKDVVISDLQKLIGVYEKQINELHIQIEQQAQIIKLRDSEYKALQEKLSRKKVKLHKLRANSSKTEVALREDFEAKLNALEEKSSTYFCESKKYKSELQGKLNEIDSLKYSLNIAESSSFANQKQNIKLLEEIEKQQAFFTQEQYDLKQQFDAQKTKHIIQPVYIQPPPQKPVQVVHHLQPQIPVQPLQYIQQPVQYVQQPPQVIYSPLREYNNKITYQQQNQPQNQIVKEAEKSVNIYMQQQSPNRNQPKVVITNNDQVIKESEKGVKIYVDTASQQ